MCEISATTSTATILAQHRDELALMRQTIQLMKENNRRYTKGSRYNRRTLLEGADALITQLDLTMTRLEKYL